MKPKKPKIYWTDKTFWGVWHKNRIENALKDHKEFDIINGEEQHVTKSVIYLEDMIYDITFGFHKLGECEGCSNV